jgi:Flp pilus assembly protein TadG
MSLVDLCKRFSADQRGVVAVVFAFALLPLMLATGAAIDYARATSARVDLQSAVDAAALAVGRAAIELNRLDNTVQARQAFDAGFKPQDGTSVVRFEVTQDTRRIVVDVDARIPLAFASLLRMDSIDVNARAEVPLDDVTLEVALVLDNTGSMGSSGRMTALKTASKNLITKLQNASVVNTNAFVAIVPFATQVRSPIAYQTLPWVRYSTQVPANTWAGCLADRDQPHDVSAAHPNTALPETLYPAATCSVPTLAAVFPLSRQFNTLRAHIDSMGTAGNTNTGIGLAAGLAMLTPGTTLPTGARQPSRLVKKHMIFLTDGENTQNRWTTDRTQIDQRTQLMCDTIRQSNLNVVLHTILLMDGNATLLQNCATTPDRYYFVTDPAQLNAVFDAIAAELLSIRLAH